MMGDRRMRESGSSSLELVLVTPILVILMLFVAFCGRLIQARGDVDAAARDAARAATLARTPADANAAAHDAARESLAAHVAPCLNLDVQVRGTFRAGGAMRSDVSCLVRLSDLGLLAVPGARTVTGSATAPIDVYRSAP